MDFFFAGPIPPLRTDLEIVPIMHEGQPMLVVSDLMGLQDQTVAAPPVMMMIASL